MNHSISIHQTNTGRDLNKIITVSSDTPMKFTCKKLNHDSRCIYRICCISNNASIYLLEPLGRDKGFEFTHNKSYTCVEL